MHRYIDTRIHASTHPRIHASMHPSIHPSVQTQWTAFENCGKMLVLVEGSWLRRQPPLYIYIFTHLQYIYLKPSISPKGPFWSCGCGAGWFCNNAQILLHCNPVYSCKNLHVFLNVLTLKLEPNTFVFLCNCLNPPNSCGNQQNICQFVCCLWYD